MQTTTWQDPSRHHQTVWQVCRSYCQLTKPRIIPLLLIETAAACGWLPRDGLIPVCSWLPC
jgi:protoheme IX farnesyltransferase